jgi:hypothetical protein
MIKVFLGGEGSNDIGTRWHQPMGDRAGMAEALLRRVRPGGWQVAGALPWRSIRKYRAGAAARRADHADVHNVLGLVLAAYESACEMLAFVRDGDGDARREHAIRQVVAEIGAYRFSDTFHYDLAIVGGVPRPKLEGWILCLLGVADTDEMSSARVDRELAARGILAKAGAAYVALAETCELPAGGGSLARWLADAREAFDGLLDGAAPPRGPRHDP